LATWETTEAVCAATLTAAAFIAKGKGPAKNQT